MTEVGGEHRELLFDIEPLAMPAEKRPDSEAMPEVVRSCRSRFLSIR